jgi:hypothetical protein
MLGASYIDIAFLCPSLSHSTQVVMVRSSRSILDALRVGMLLCDVPTPSLLLDHSTALNWHNLAPGTLDSAINESPNTLNDLLYVHVGVLSGRDSSVGAVGATTGRGRDTPIQLGHLDCTLDEAGGPRSFVGLGLNNHFTGGYYWGRASGPGAAMPAPGVELRELAPDSASSAETQPLLQLVRVDNSNDGKRSEWCEFLQRGDQLQIVPGSPDALLASGPFDVVVGVCRTGEHVPPGAEPRVDAVWKRDRVSRQWLRAM